MARHTIVALQAPPAVDAVREIEAPAQAAYRQGRSATRVLLRVREQPASRPPAFFVVAFLLWFVVGAALLTSVPLFALFLCLTFAGLLWWATKAPPKPTGVGYSGTLRIEDGQLHGGDSVLELAHVNDVYVHTAEDGVTLSARTRDGDHAVATRINDIEVARYLAAQIAEAADAAKRDVP